MLMNKMITLLSVAIFLSGCTGVNVNQRCSIFEEGQWVQTSPTEIDLEELREVHRALAGHDGQRWFKNQEQQLGLCGYSKEFGSKTSSCGTTYVVFQKTDGKWTVEREGLTLCHDHS